MNKQTLIPSLIIVVIAVIIVAGVRSCFTNSTPLPTLNARVTVAGGTLRVGNLDMVPWQDCRITINGHWSGQIGSVPEQSAVDAPLAAFTRRDGGRFNVITNAVQEVSLWCQRSGKGVGYVTDLR